MDTFHFPNIFQRPDTFEVFFFFSIPFSILSILLKFLRHVPWFSILKNSEVVVSPKNMTNFSTLKKEVSYPI